MRTIRLILCVWLWVFSLPLIHAQDGDTSDKIELTPFVMQESNVGGLAPLAWVQIQPGVFTRESATDDLTTLIHVAQREATIAQVAQPFVFALELDALPDESEAEPYSGGAFEWLIYSFELEVSELDVGVLTVDIAVAEDNLGAYLVALQTTPAEREALQAAVFFPALDAFGLPMSTVSRGADAFTFVDVDIPEFDVSTAVPAHWRSSTPGVFSRADISQDGTTLLIQTDSELDALTFGTSLIERFGFSEDDLEDGELYETDSLDWTLHELEIDDGESISILHVALAENDDAALMVVLLTSQLDSERLREGVLLPVLDNLVYIG